MEPIYTSTAADSSNSPACAGLNLLTRSKVDSSALQSNCMEKRRMQDNGAPTDSEANSFSRLNCLPFELEREIFEIAAAAYPKCVPSIIRVAKRFHKWFEPEFYRILRTGEDNIIRPPFLYDDYTPTHNPKGVLHDSNTLHSHFHRVSSSSPILTLNTSRLAKFGPWVRHALIQNRSVTEIRAILEHCPNITNLAIWIVHGDCSTLLPALDDFARVGNLRRLSFDPCRFFSRSGGFPDLTQNPSPGVPIPFSLPLFATLTHLEIINATPSWHKWSELGHMPRLTHLALTGVVYEPLIKGVMRSCKTLEVFVIFDLDARLASRGQDAGGSAPADVDDVDADDEADNIDANDVESSFASAPGVTPGEDDQQDEPHEDWRTDTRIVMLKSVKDHLDHWELGARGGCDFWVIAEKLRNSRRASRRAAAASKLNT